MLLFLSKNKKINGNVFKGKRRFTLVYLCQ